VSTLQCQVRGELNALEPEPVSGKMQIVAGPLDASNVVGVIMSVSIVIITRVADDIDAAAVAILQFRRQGLLIGNLRLQWKNINIVLVSLLRLILDWVILLGHGCLASLVRRVDLRGIGFDAGALARDHLS